jgi:hypothetical protein
MHYFYGPPEVPMQNRSTKRQKEQAREQKRKEKEERKVERKKLNLDKPNAVEGEDPDIAGIIPGPQPPLF